MSKLISGCKYDDNKIRYDLIPSDSLHELAKVYTHGAQKYEDDNWRKGMDWKRIMGAIERHYHAWKRGQEIDPDSGLFHLAQVAWGCFTLLNYSKTHPNLDTRTKDLKEGVDINKENIKFILNEIKKSSGNNFNQKILLD